MNKKLDTETGIFIAQCTQALRDSFESASYIQRVIAFWPLIIGALVITVVHWFDRTGVFNAIVVLLPFFILAAIGWGDKTSKWAKDVISTLNVFTLNFCIKLPDLLVKSFSRIIPVLLSPPRFHLA